MKAGIIATALLTLAAGAAGATDKPKAATPSEPETPPLAEPIKCFIGVGVIDGDMTIGLATDLCGGATNGVATVTCYAQAFGSKENGLLGLTRGQAVRLCKPTGAAQSE